MSSEYRNRSDRSHRETAESHPPAAAANEHMANSAAPAIDDIWSDQTPLEENPLLRRLVLDNGFTITVLPNKFPDHRFYAYLEVKVGSLNEDDKQQGIAHFLEHVVFLGCKKWGTAEAMRELMASLGMSFGGDTNASTDQRATTYSLEAPSEAGNEALVIEILFQMAFKALLTDACIDSERSAVLSEKQMRNDVFYRCSCLMMQLMHPDSLIPRRLPIGLEEQIQRFSSEDMRAFYRKFYFPANMTLFLVGKLDVEAAIEAARLTFGAEPAREQSAVPREPVLPPPAAAREGGHRFGVFWHDLLTQYTCSVGCVEPMVRCLTAADYAAVVTDQLILSCFEDRIEAIRTSHSSPPFTAIELDFGPDMVAKCNTLSLSVSSRPKDWRRATRVALTEVSITCTSSRSYAPRAHHNLLSRTRLVALTCTNLTITRRLSPCFPL